MKLEIWFLLLTTKLQINSKADFYFTKHQAGMYILVGVKVDALLPVFKLHNQCHYFLGNPCIKKIL